MSGTEAIKTTLGFAIKFGMNIEDALANDGKITWNELFSFVPTLLKVPALIKAVPELKDEFTDLDDTEKAELSEWLATELDLDNDKVEMYIEEAWKLLLALSALIKINETPA